jgi:hypothetical protein
MITRRVTQRLVSSPDTRWRLKRDKWGHDCGIAPVTTDYSQCCHHGDMAPHLCSERPKCQRALEVLGPCHMISCWINTKQPVLSDTVALEPDLTHVGTPALTVPSERHPSESRPRKNYILQCNTYLPCLMTEAAAYRIRIEYGQLNDTFIPNHSSQSEND